MCVYVLSPGPVEHRHLGGNQDIRRLHGSAQLAIRSPHQQLESARQWLQHNAQLWQALLLWAHERWAVCLCGCVAAALTCVVFALVVFAVTAMMAMAEGS